MATVIRPVGNYDTESALRSRHQARGRRNGEEVGDGGDTTGRDEACFVTGMTIICSPGLIGSPLLTQYVFDTAVYRYLGRFDASSSAFTGPVAT